jgi:LDH2 family malate/lactate/ureidoglycolate dehydrogenase
MTDSRSKLELSEPRIMVSAAEAADMAIRMLEKMGVTSTVAQIVVEHLIDANYCGVESHGIWRVIQYVEYYRTGYLKSNVLPELKDNGRGAMEVNAFGGIGIPAMNMAQQHVCAEAEKRGIAAITLRNIGHTGRLGAFADEAASQGYLLIIIGGGGSKNWRLVAPYGGAKPLLSTNPYCIGVPAGDRGPVVLDFATSAVAGGWVYSALTAGAKLPEGAIIDSEGKPTCDPQDYFDGGALLPAGGAKGYALSVAAEMIAEAMLGPVVTECNWLMIAIDTKRYQEPSTLQTVAEEILQELRDCPPAPGFEKVEIPGERERDLREKNRHLDLALPKNIWQQIQETARELDVL